MVEQGRGLDPGSGLSDLDRKIGTLPVLVYLYAHGSATKTLISRLLGHRHETIAGTLDVLQALELIRPEKETWFPFRETFSLTLLGKDLVEAPILRWPSLLTKKAR
jgi:hypothetical protein